VFLPIEDELWDWLKEYYGLESLDKRLLMK
jgi:hypothetical protein